jgi:hypothetical protein
MKILSLFIKQNLLSKVRVKETVNELSFSSSFEWLCLYGVLTRPIGFTGHNNRGA